MQKIFVDSGERLGHIHKELHGQFIEALGGCIYDGIWVGQDSAVPDIHGLRREFVEAFREIAPPLIRWPGGCYADTYHWRDGIGPREKRPVRYNENFGTFELDRNEFGTHEFMDLCRLTGAEPWLNVNMLSGSVQEMKDWMEYCNRDDNTDLKKERERNGAGEPFRVAYWGIGNEPWAGGGNYTAHSYVDEYRKYASAAPSFRKSAECPPDVPLRPILAGPDGNKEKERVAWTKDVFRALSEYRLPPLYGMDLHFYNWNISDMDDTDVSFDEKGWYRVVEGCLELESVIGEQYSLIQQGIQGLPKPEGAFGQPEPSCALLIGEWGNWHGSAFTSRPALFQQVTMRDAVTTALTLDIFHRNCTKVRAACVAQTVNVLNALFLAEGEHFLKTPNYDVFKMYMVHRDAELLGCRQQEGPIHALASQKDGIISVNAVNTSYGAAETMELMLPDGCSFLGGETLSSERPQDFNSWEQPDRIRAREAVAPAFDGSGWEAELPPASVNVFRFRANHPAAS